MPLKEIRNSDCAKHRSVLCVDSRKRTDPTAQTIAVVLASSCSERRGAGWLCVCVWVCMRNLLFLFMCQWKFDSRNWRQSPNARLSLVSALSSGNTQSQPVAKDCGSFCRPAKFASKSHQNLHPPGLHVVYSRERNRTKAKQESRAGHAEKAYKFKPVAKKGWPTFDSVSFNEKRLPGDQETCGLRKREFSPIRWFQWLWCEIISIEKGQSKFRCPSASIDLWSDFLLIAQIKCQFYKKKINKFLNDFKR